MGTNSINMIMRSNCSRHFHRAGIFIKTKSKMKSVVFSYITCLLFCSSSLVTSQQSSELEQITELLEKVIPRNETANADIKEKIQNILKEMDSAFIQDDTSLDNSKRVLKRIDLCRKGLLYIKDNITRTETDLQCDECVKEPDTANITQLLDDIGPAVWNKIDVLISGLLVDAAVSLKGLNDEEKIEAYKKKLYCNAERMNLSSEEVDDEEPVDLDGLLANIIDSLEEIQPENITANTIISTKISDALKVLDPMICADAFVPTDYGRTLKKVLICKKALIYIRENITTIDEGIQSMNCTGTPDTRPLIFLLYDFAPEIAGKINHAIGKILVSAAVDLKILPDGEEREEYIKQLNFNINRLNLIW